MSQGIVCQKHILHPHKPQIFINVGPTLIGTNSRKVRNFHLENPIYIFIFDWLLRNFSIQIPIDILYVIITKATTEDSP